MKPKEPQIVAGLDVGTSTVRAVVCNLYSSGKMEIIGVGQSPSLGIRKGMVSNIEKTVESISSAVREAEEMGGCAIEKVFVGITGAHIRSCNSSGVVAVRADEVEAEDIDRVIESAQSVATSADEKILHVLPQSFTIDDIDGIQDPIGMCGGRLEAKVHVITVNTSTMQNLLKCVNQCDLEVESVALNQISTGTSVLSDDEKELGVCLLDIGKGTTDIAVFHEGAICHSAVIPIAGAQITRDIAVTMRTATATAEKLKRRYASAHVPSVDPEDAVEVAETRDRPARTINHIDLANVVEPRVDELFRYIKADLERSGNLALIGSGFVLAGGGARMNGILKLAEQVFESPARVGVPNYGSALSEVVHHPSFATVVGLCQIGLQERSFEPEEYQAYDEADLNITNRLLGYFKSLSKNSNIEGLTYEGDRVRSGT